MKDRIVDEIHDISEKTDATYLYFKMEGLEPNIEGSKIHFTIGFVSAKGLSLLGIQYTKHSLN